MRAIRITLGDVVESGSIEAAIESHCHESDRYATGVVGPSFATSGPGAGWSTQYGPADFARRAIEEGAEAYIDLDDGRVATLADDGTIEWSEESVIEMVVPSIDEVAENPTEAAEMARGAFGLHACKSDRRAWAKLVESVRSMYESMEDIEVDA
jgi:hypothetical protein